MNLEECKSHVHDCDIFELGLDEDTGKKLCHFICKNCGWDSGLVKTKFNEQFKLNGLTDDKCAHQWRGMTFSEIVEKQARWGYSICEKCGLIEWRSE